MATQSFTAQVEDDGSLTIPRETLSALGVKPGDMLDVSLYPHRLISEEPLDGAPPGEPKNLAELLGDLIGSVHGSGENLSENSGEKFTDYLVQKHRDGHL